MNIEDAQKLIESLGGIEKSKEIIKNCPKDCTAYREAIGSTVIKDIPIDVMKTALAVLGDMNKPKYFSITYDMSKLSDDEQKAVIAEASSLFQSGKAVSAGWESGDNGWISVDDKLPPNKGVQKEITEMPE